jgi:4-hydroxybenzoate polyprenyltransferase
MKIVFAFFRLIRWPNLFFIALTQLLFYHCIGILIQEDLVVLNISQSTNPNFIYFTIAASVLIAAAGYIINDYFDLPIDYLNKPNKIVIEKIIKRRWGILWHLILSAAGLACSFYVSYLTHQWLIVMVNTMVVLSLWFYSTHFKKKLLIGNVLISALTSWVIFVVFCLCRSILIEFYHSKTAAFFAISHLFKFAVLYAGFAFIITLVREVVKDMEDMDGDAGFGCKTMPIKWGIPATKVFAAVWIVVAIASMFILQIYAWHLGWRLSILYVGLSIILPLIWMIFQLKKATTSADYHQLSNMLKWVMLAGILSMLFFKF